MYLPHCYNNIKIIITIAVQLLILPFWENFVWDRCNRLGRHLLIIYLNCCDNILQLGKILFHISRWKNIAIYCLNICLQLELITLNSVTDKCIVWKNCATHSVFIKVTTKISFNLKFHIHHVRRTGGGGAGLRRHTRSTER